MLFQTLEQRCLLATISLTDALAVNAVDHDGDGLLRAFDLQYAVAADGAGGADYRVDVFAQSITSIGPSARQHVLQSGIETIQAGQTRTTRYTIRPEYIGWPQDADPRVHFSLALTRIGFETTQFEDVDISDVSMERANEDAAGNDAPPALTAFGASPDGSATALTRDTTVHFSTRAVSATGISSVTFFFDRNGNSILDSADLFYLPAAAAGDAYGTVQNATLQSGTVNDGIWSLDLQVNPEWSSGTTSWGAIALGTDGNVSPVAITSTRISQPVRVENVSVQVLRGSFIDLHDAAQWYQNGDGFLFGETILLHPTLTIAAPVANVYYIFDKDGNGRWTDGVDTILGQGDATRNYDLSFVLDSNWGVRTPARIIVDAVDSNGLWTDQRGHAAFTVTDRPVVSNVVAPPTAAAGQTMRLTATVADTSPRAVTWFIDRLANFRFDPGIDIDLGADFDGSNGWSRDVLVTPQMAGRSVIMAAAVDTENSWSSASPSGGVWISAGPIVAFMTVSPARSLFAKGESVTLTAAVSVGIPLTGVTFFLDLDADGSFNNGRDIDLGADRDAAGGWTKTITIPAGWPASGVKFGANAFNGPTFGDFSTVTASTYGFSDGPLVGTVSNPGSVTWGEPFTVTASNIRGSNVRAVTFFFDANHDGRWTAGIDTDLGADFDGTNGWSITTTARSTWAPTTIGQICASAQNTDLYWGRTAGVTSAFTVFDRPRLSNATFTSPSIIGPNTITFGSGGTVGATAIALTGIVAFTYFVDIDHDGRWTSGVDIDLGGVFVTSTINSVTTKTVTFDWGHGAFTVMADARDTRGRWSGAALAQVLTLV